MRAIRNMSLAMVFACALASAPAFAQPEPDHSQKQGESPAAPSLYDESAVGRTQIDEALARAKKENKRVLIQWGANWCGWCHLLHKTFDGNQDVKRELSYEYEVVLIDIGKWDKHLDLAAQYKADFKKEGVPYLTVLDADGNVIANQETGSLEKTIEGKSGHDPEKVLEFLTKHQAPYLKAEDILSNALSEAESQHKRVFLHFGAPWCGWCHRLEAWAGEENVASILSADFIDVKIDVDRTIGGKDVMARYTGGENAGYPFFVFLDADGTIVEDSLVDGIGNLGCPWSDEEQAAFSDVLKRACRTITDEQREKLIGALRAMRGDK